MIRSFPFVHSFVRSNMCHNVALVPYFYILRQTDSQFELIFYRNSLSDKITVFYTHAQNLNKNDADNFHFWRQVVNRIFFENGPTSWRKCISVIYVEFFHEFRSNGASKPVHLCNRSMGTLIDLAGTRSCLLSWILYGSFAPIIGRKKCGCLNC